MVDENVELVCYYDGVPLPAVFWHWQKCNLAGCSPSPSQWERVAQSRNIPQVEKGNGRMILRILARESGFYKCEGSNKEGLMSKVVDFFVTGWIFHCTDSDSVQAASPLSQNSTKNHRVLISGEPRSFYHFAHLLIFQTFQAGLVCLMLRASQPVVSSLSLAMN